MEKNRLEAFSDGTFAIILTILVLELHFPHLEDNTFAAFMHAGGEILPKLLAFAFSFFILAIFWVNHHYMVHHIKKVDSKLLWLNIALLFFSSLFPFLTASIGDYPENSFIVALYPLNMALSALTLRAFWKHAFVDTNLAPNTLTDKEKKKRLRQDATMVFVNLGAAALAFVWIPITLTLIMALPFLFVIPEFLHPKTENRA